MGERGGGYFSSPPPPPLKIFKVAIYSRAKQLVRFGQNYLIFGQAWQKINGARDLSPQTGPVYAYLPPPPPRQVSGPYFRALYSFSSAYHYTCRPPKKKILRLRIIFDTSQISGLDYDWVCTTVYEAWMPPPPLYSPAPSTHGMPQVTTETCYNFLLWSLCGTRACSVDSAAAAAARVGVSVEAW